VFYHERRITHDGSDELLFGDLLEVGESQLGKEFLLGISFSSLRGKTLINLIMYQVRLETSWSRIVECICGNI
jgi:hypothetical protein